MHMHNLYLESENVIIHTVSVDQFMSLWLPGNLS